MDRHAFQEHGRPARLRPRADLSAPLRIFRSHRHCTACRVPRFDLAAVRRDLLEGRAVEGGFAVLNTGLAPAVKTVFRVYDDGRRLLVAVCLRDLAAPVRETVELCFNPWNDGIGYYQFATSSDGGTRPVHFTCAPDNHTTFAPYEEAHTSAYRHPRMLKTRWELPAWARPGGRGVPADETETSAFVFAWFDARELFRTGKAVGFNVARAPGDSGDALYSREYGSWNPCSGVCGADASSLGRLYRAAPVDWADGAAIERTAGGLRLEGRCAGATRIAFRLADPAGGERACKAGRKGDRWDVRVPLADPLPGRYRLYAEAPGVALEPRYVAFDVAPAASRPFTFSMTYDVPDDIVNNPLPYTPEALAAEMDLMRAHGIDRIHWLDYPPETLYRAGKPQHRQTQRHCGDLLPLAASLAKARGMRFLGIFKPFDLASDNSLDATAGHTVRNLEGRNLWVPEALAERQDAVQAVSAVWFPPVPEALPARIRLYSREPLPRMTARDFHFWTSADNRHYEPYRGPMTVCVRRVRRPHQRWTAAGNVPEPSSALRYALEFDGLRLPAPYIAFQIDADVRLVERAHALGEAWSADGRPLPVVLERGAAFPAAPGRPVLCQSGFEYWKQLNWINASPFMLSDVTVGKGVHGMVCAMPRTQPTLLEPCCEGAREVWLARVQRILDTEADGLSIRTLCFHNRVMDFMRMAFAPAVREQFRAEYGREPEPTWEDAVRVRELRGRAYTGFLRECKARAARAGKILAIHLEAGIEVPPWCDQRMQMHLDWETWIRDGIADEVLLKWWFSQNPFIHERVLPLARRHGVPVHIIDRNGSLKTPRAVERAVALARESRMAGFDGYAWYEAASWKRRNALNVPEFKGHIGDALRAAAAVSASGGS